MNSPDKIRFSNWKHPMAISLLSKYEYQLPLEDIIEIETKKLLAGVGEEFPTLFRKGTPATPIEAVASALSVRVTPVDCMTGFSATVKQTNEGYEFSRNATQHYYRQRFSLAHEVAHIVLSKLAGPLNTKALHHSRNKRNEEEAMCDLFASALLMPKSS